MEVLPLIEAKNGTQQEEIFADNLLFCGG